MEEDPTRQYIAHVDANNTWFATIIGLVKDNLAELRNYSFFLICIYMFSTLFYLSTRIKAHNVGIVERAWLVI